MKIRFAVGPSAGSPAGDELVAYARAVQAHGFDGIWLSDLPAAAVIDPLLGLALVAGHTDRLRLGANLVPLGRNPFLLAKQLAQLDQISGGRLLLSFVTGLGGACERQVLGLGPAGRGAVLEDTLAAVRRWWDGAAVPGACTGAPPVTQPVQAPLEVWLGGRGPQALDRVGRIADGWLGAQLTAAEAGAARVSIQQAAARAGRQIDPEHFGLSIPYARSAPSGEIIAALRGRRADIDPRALIPVGREGLRSFIGACVTSGLSKFVVRPVHPVRNWEQEAQWLADAILDLQT